MKQTMQKQKPTVSSKKGPVQSATKAVVAKPLRWDYIVILFAYTIVPVATPIMEAFDANGPKFLAIAILNLLSFSYLLTVKPIRSDQASLVRELSNKLGIVYLLFLFFVLLSFFKAINVYESVITFSKIFSIFSAAYIVSIVLAADKRYITWLCTAFSLMLIFDSFTVLYHMSQFLAGTVPSIYVIKSVYSNKNILTAAVFVKIPFALWLFTYRQGWLRVLAIFTLFVAILSTLFMSTRTFYLGLIVISLSYIAYNIIRYYRDRDRVSMTLLAQYLVALILAIGAFSFTQKFLYPKTGAGMLNAEYNVDLVSRLSTVAQGEGGRNKSWNRTIQLIKEDPLLGVGTGNWKIKVLKYENQDSHDYTYMYKNHNDFLEITAENGIFGGILFLSLFVMVGISFLFSFLKHRSAEESYSLLFLPAFGLFAYSFDAFFNFPADRPEIGALFAVFVAAGMAYSPSWMKIRAAGPAELTSGGEGSGKQFLHARFLRVLIPVVLIPLMIGSIYTFIQNYRSIIIQRMVKSEMAAGKLTMSSDFVMKGLPVFPTVSLEGEPIAVHKARYLINEAKYQQAIDILKPDKSSPFDTRQEFFISMAYYNLGQMDSSIHYSMKVFENKPLFFNNTSNLCRSLASRGQLPEAFKIMDTYLSKMKTNGEAWIFTSSLYDNSGDYKKALTVMDSALRYLPSDTTVIKQQRMLSAKVKIKPNEQLYFSALEKFNQKKYPEAVRLLTEFIDKEPGLADAYDFRAFAYFFLNDHKKSLTDVEKALALGPMKPNLLNLRGVNYHMLGNDDAACIDFNLAKSMGDKDAVSNIQKFCQKK